MGRRVGAFANLAPLRAAFLRGAGPALRQQGTENTQSASETILSVTLASPPLLGSKLVLMWSSVGTHQMVSADQTRGVTWTLVNKELGASNRVVELWRGEVTSPTAQQQQLFTVAVPLTSNVRLNMSEWTGLVSGVDVSAIANGSSVTPSITLTPTAARLAVLISNIRPPSAPSAGPSVGWTAMQTQQNGAFVPAYRIVPVTAGSYTNQYTVTTGIWAAVAASFLAPP